MCCRSSVCARVLRMIESAQHKFAGCGVLGQCASERVCVHTACIFAWRPTPSSHTIHTTWSEQRPPPSLAPPSLAIATIVCPPSISREKIRPFSWSCHCDMPCAVCTPCTSRCGCAGMMLLCRLFEYGLHLRSIQDARMRIPSAHLIEYACEICARN